MLYSSRVIALKLQTKGKITEEQEKTKDVKEGLKDHRVFLTLYLHPNFISKLTVPEIYLCKIMSLILKNFYLKCKDNSSKT